MSGLVRRVLRLAGHTVVIGIGGPARPTGAPVVLLPGLGMSARYLEPTATALLPHRLVVAPDPPGTGASPRPATPLTVTELADLVHELLLATTGPAVVVGNSFGCVVAVELALRHPEAVRRLVLTSAAVAPGIRTLGPVAVRFLAAMRREPAGYRRIAMRDLGRGWGRKRRANLRALLGYPIEDNARRLTVPTLVVRGRLDMLVPDEFARRLAAGIPRGDHVELAAAHALPYSAPDEIARLVLDDDPGPGCP